MRFVSDSVAGEKSQFARPPERCRDDRPRSALETAVG